MPALFHINVLAPPVVAIDGVDSVSVPNIATMVPISHNPHIVKPTLATVSAIPDHYLLNAIMPGQVDTPPCIVRMRVRARAMSIMSICIPFHLTCPVSVLSKCHIWYKPYPGPARLHAAWVAQGAPSHTLDQYSLHIQTRCVLRHW